MNHQMAFFGGSIPENYDAGLGPHIFADFAGELAARVAAEDPKTVLELAAGTGIVTRCLRDALPLDCRLVATDLSLVMLGIAAAKFDPGEEVTFEEVDAMWLPYDDDTFDLIACQFGVMFFPDKVESFKEARRVLKPGGVYHLNVWDGWDGNPFARIVHEAVEKFFQKDPPQFYKVPFSYPDPEVIEADLKAGGFEEIAIETVNFVKEIDYPLFVQGLLHGNPVAAEIEERGANIEEITNGVEAALKSEFGDPGEMPLRAWFVRAA